MQHRLYFDIIQAMILFPYHGGMDWYIAVKKLQLIVSIHNSDVELRGFPITHPTTLAELPQDNCISALNVHADEQVKQTTSSIQICKNVVFIKMW